MFNRLVSAEMHRSEYGELVKIAKYDQHRNSKPISMSIGLVWRLFFYLWTKVTVLAKDLKLGGSHLRTVLVHGDTGRVSTLR